MGFLFFFLGAYTAMNAYLVGKVWVAFSALGRWRFLVAAFVLLMVAGPFIVQATERWRWFRLSEAFATVVFIWMALALWFGVLMAAGDAWNLLAWLSHFVVPATAAAIAPARVQLCIVAPILALALAAGLRKAQDIRLVEVRIPVPSLPDGRRELRIVQLADLHLGLHVRMDRLEKIVVLVREARPDLLVSTGDLLDAPLEQAAPWPCRWRT